MLSERGEAESLYRESIAYLERTRVRAQLARVHLLYGEWLRHERLRADARQQLPTACDMLDAIGVQAFGERARRGLLVTSEIARKRIVETTGELTSQEVHIARLARDGLSNPEIGARLFIGARTVQYHLGKVFTKLAVSSRSELTASCPATRPRSSRTSPPRRATRPGLATPAPQQYSADIEAGARTALAAVGPTPYFQR
jgi:DNA-binding CsgD family transcriptional regulator